MPDSYIDLKTSKYQELLDVVKHQFEKAEIPLDRLYMIDKVVRIRAQHGRFGIDHSELLNFEIDQTNKLRDEHMNHLVYKEEANRKFPPQTKTLSTILKERLNIQPEELDIDDLEIGRIQLSSEQKEKLGNEYLGMSAEQQQKMNYKEWLKHKNAEQRLKQKLVQQAQDDIRSFLMQI